mgnify:CR=1 FL=1
MKEKMKENPKHIRISEYNYPLPEERIAKFPLPVRDQSKLLVYRQGAVTEDVFTSLPKYLAKDSLMIFNNTKVIQARLHFRKETGALIEVFCLEPVQPNDYALNFQQTEHAAWLCMIGNLKKWKEGPLHRELTVKGHPLTLTATRGECRGTSHWVDFSWNNSEVTFADILEVFGELPIPPYLNRETQESDKETYQTVYSKIKGSVAAPTAGLHFTTELLDQIKAKGIKIAHVTLHVGLGTFRPVKEENILDHHMHSEFCIIEQDAADMINETKAAGGRVVSVGTTSTRTLESMSDDDGTVHAGSKWTDIFIYPGYKFKVIDALITNFHLPESTLLMLVSALYDREHILEAYKVAVEEKYRFFSFGDAMLIV